MDQRHLARFAVRQAYQTGNVCHVVATGEPIAPFTVIDDHALFALADQVDPRDVMFSADPFADAVA
ncbi:hypothetical protein FHS79_002775 [Polymorphobacter multimanifer]|uniref:Uncharacterized protein n=2 Tax=Polymorphobacter multimanifer TaxID=1070431 RepID=A0A841LFJ5_9SPHN|nr:hypothetical protein [Polymorphobacter multimanifer]MBB6228585.1 hypothetical protein [Polymorphobacter multimanifer]